eukprot:gene27393-biopygen17889
MSRGVCS